MKKIKLTQGQYALVDDDDYTELNKYKWHAHCQNKNDYYAQRNIRNVNGKQTMIRMHRVIMNAPNGLDVDHRNHCCIDNRKSNLRICNRSQNQMNELPRKDGTSKYKGVCWVKRDRKWVSRIRINDKCIYLGQFDNEMSAAKTYDNKAKELFGEFACFNFEYMIRTPSIDD